jgi:hypothetical protein
LSAVDLRAGLGEREPFAKLVALTHAEILHPFGHIVTTTITGRLPQLPRILRLSGAEQTGSSPVGPASFHRQILLKTKG